MLACNLVFHLGVYCNVYVFHMLTAILLNRQSFFPQNYASKDRLNFLENSGPFRLILQTENRNRKPNRLSIGFPHNPGEWATSSCSYMYIVRCVG